MPINPSWQRIGNIRGNDGAPGIVGPAGKDGTSIDPSLIRAMVIEEVQKQMQSIPKAINGKDGRDAPQIDILPAIDTLKNYPRGTFARFQGGLIRAYRDSSPMTDTIEKAGWEVIVEGLSDLEMTQPDERTLLVRAVMTSGKAIEYSASYPLMLYREIYQPKKQYQRGDVVTWSGSSWHCQKDTQSQPGIDSDWKLMVREGRAARPQQEKKPIEREPIRLA